VKVARWVLRGANLSNEVSLLGNLLKSKFCDLLFKVNTRKGETGFVYCLLEQQTKPDPTMPLRMMKYIIEILSRHVKPNKPLPLVAPLIFFNGRQKYNVPRSLADMFEDPAMAQKLLLGEYPVIELAKISDEELKNSGLSFIMQFAMKHYYDQEILRALEQMLSFVRYFPGLQDKLRLFIEDYLCYNFSNIKEENLDNVKRLINDNLTEAMGEQIMGSLAEKWHNDVQQSKQQGMQQGMQQGAYSRNVTIAKNMLKEGLDVSLISKVTNLSVQEILKLKLSK